MGEREEEVPLSDADVAWEVECFLSDELRKCNGDLHDAWSRWQVYYGDDFTPEDVARIRAAIVHELRATRRRTPPQEPQP